MNIIEIESLQCRLQNKIIIENISLNLAASSCCGLIGPNGAGKTTLLRVLSGLLDFQQGQIKALGLALPENRLKIQPQLGLYLGELGFYNHLTIEENLLLSGHLYELDQAENKKRSAFLLDLLGLSNVKTTLISRASKGMQKKTAIALSLIHDPKILLWDEPFEGIDFPSLQKIFQAVQQLTEKGRCFLIVSHIFDYLSSIITHYAALVDGTIASQGVFDKGTSNLQETFNQVTAGNHNEAKVPWL